MEKTKYLIVGGGLAGVNAASAIRERDKEGRVILVTEERHLPYDRVPLSKGYLLGKLRRENLFPKKAEFFEQQRIEILLGRRATALDAKIKVVKLDDGTEIFFDKLLISTGGTPRRLPIPGSGLGQIYYFRTLEDCEALKALLSERKKVVIVGGGFIGCELAAACVSHGLETTIIEMLPRILSLAFDPETSSWIENRLTEQEIKVKTDAQAEEFVGGGEGSVVGVKIKGGEVVACDLVLVGVGLIPRTELAEQAGLKTDRGIVVDEHLQTSEPGIFAAGDVARFYHPVMGRHIRVEHYDVAVKHGRIAGANMAGDYTSSLEEPYFFSHLPGLTINAYGDVAAREKVLRRGALGTPGFFKFFFEGGLLKGFISVNRPYSEIKVARSILARRPTLEDVGGLTDEGRSLTEFAGVAT